MDGPPDNSFAPPRWQRIGIFPGWRCDERLWHAGLNATGSHCFVAGFEDNVYVICEVPEGTVVWREDATEGSEASVGTLDELVDHDGLLVVAKSPTREPFRLFGLERGPGRIRHEARGIALSIDLTRCQLVLHDLAGHELERHSYESDSGDWAYASVCDAGSVIAVLEPYNVTFFGRVPNAASRP